MNKWGVGAAAVVAVAAAGVLGGSFVMGKQIEQGFQDAAAHASVEGLTVQVVRYERGWLHSSAETLWTYVDSRDGDESAGDDEGENDAPDALPHDPVQLKATHHITHGPWAWGHAAQIATDVLLTAGGNTQLMAALQGRPLLQWATTVGWNRGTEHQASAPALQWDADGTQIDWGGLQAQWQMPRNLRSIRGSVQLPALRMQEADQRTLAVQDAALQLDLQQPEGLQWMTGPWSLRLATLQVQPAADDASATGAWQAQGLQLDSSTTLQGDVAQMQLSGALQSLQLGGTALQDLALKLAVRNVDAAWLNQQLGWRATDDAPDRLQQLSQQLPQLLARQPSIELERLALGTPDGPSEVGASLRYTGDGQRPQQLLQDLKASVHAQLPEPVLRTLLAQRVRQSLLQQLDEEERDDVDAAALEAAVKTQVDERMAALTGMGALQPDGKLLRAQLDLGQGQMQLNGQPLDVTASQQLLEALIP